MSEEYTEVVVPPAVTLAVVASVMPPSFATSR